MTDALQRAAETVPEVAEWAYADSQDRLGCHCIEAAEAIRALAERLPVTCGECEYAETCLPRRGFDGFHVPEDFGCTLGRRA